MSPQEKICRHIRERIGSGELRPGMQLPPHRELSRQFSVAITTVTRAVNRLKTEGVLAGLPARTGHYCSRAAASRGGKG